MDKWQASTPQCKQHDLGWALNEIIMTIMSNNDITHPAVGRLFNLELRVSGSDVLFVVPGTCEEDLSRDMIWLVMREWEDQIKGIVECWTAKCLDSVSWASLCQVVRGNDGYRREGEADVPGNPGEDHRCPCEV